MLSVIIPAHNEASLIGRTLESVGQALQAMDAPHEVVVVDDGSTDATAAIARRAGATVVQIEARQIAAARNAGAGAARGDRLVFVDADTLLPAATLRAAIDALAGGAVGGGCAVRFDGRIPVYARLMLPLLTISFRWSRLAAGCFMFCQRDHFERAGGFNEELYAAEEIDFSRAMKMQGRFVVLREHVVTSGRKLRTHSGPELLWTCLKIGLRGNAGVRDRRFLDVWYAPRRPDPEPTDP